MRTDPLPYDVRELVIRTFEYFDVFLESPWDLDETILLDDGRYSARTYEAEGHMAMWLLDIGIVQFYDPDGNMLRTVNLFEELEPQRMAAYARQSHESAAVNFLPRQAAADRRKPQKYKIEPSPA